MRIFISYGRDDGTEIARRLAAWLRERGYEPWLDVADGIRVAESFDVRIEVGISGSRVLIALLSTGSLKPGGFCRNELLFAQSRDVPIVPVRISDVTPPIQIISLQYVDAVENPEAAFDCLPGIIERVLRKGGVGFRDWPGEQRPNHWWTESETLDFSFELAQHATSFAGRDWLLVQLAEWLQSNASKVLLLTAEPGFGKSAITAQLTTRLNVRGYHFCARSNIGSCRPRAWLKTLVRQLAFQFPAYARELAQLEPPPAITDPAESLFRQLVADPLRRSAAQLPAGERWILLVDGLDEAKHTENGALIDLLASSIKFLPDWIRLILTSRPDPDISARFNVPGGKLLRLESSDEKNLSDVRAFLDRSLPPGVATLERDRIACEAAGNFLFAKMALEGGLALCSVSSGQRSLPENLNGLYAEMFRARFPDPDYYQQNIRPLVDCLIAARAPLPERLLQKAAPEVDLGPAIAALSQFLTADPAGYRLYHQSLAEWLTSLRHAGSYAVSVDQGHHRLADACWSAIGAAQPEIRGYIDEHLPAHLRHAGRWADLLKFLEAKDFALLSRWVDGGESEEGLHCLDGLIRHLRSNTKQDELRAGLATQLARIYSSRGAYEKAAEFLAEALAATSIFRGRRVRSVALHELASLNLYRGNYDRVGSLYRKALWLCRMAPGACRDELAANLIGLAWLYKIRHGYRKAIRLAKAARKHAQRVGDLRHLTAAERLLAGAMLDIGQIDRSELHLRTATYLAGISSQRSELTRLRILEANLLYQQSCGDRAMLRKTIEVLEIARKDADLIQNEFNLLEAQVSLAWCALALGDTEAAKHWLDHCASILRPGFYPEHWASYHLVRSLVAHLEGDLDAADAGYEKVFQACLRTHMRWTLARALIGRGGVASERRDSRAALEYWKRASRIAGRISPWIKKLVEDDIERCKANPHHAPV